MGVDSIKIGVGSSVQMNIVPRESLSLSLGNSIPTEKQSKNFIDQVLNPAMTGQGFYAGIENGSRQTQPLTDRPAGSLIADRLGGIADTVRRGGESVVKGARQVGGRVVEGSKKAVGGTVNSVVEGANGAVGAVQELLGAQPKPRALNQPEISLLRGVYGNKLDYSKIRLVEGDLGLKNGLAPHTLRNTIYIPKGWLDSKSADYQARRNELLVHESAHAWQYQNGGADYIYKSIYHQSRAFVSGGDRGGAYDFVKGIKEGKTWAQLNPEQQAKLIENAYVAGMFSNSNARFVLNTGEDYTKYVSNAIKEIRAGRGAP